MSRTGFFLFPNYQDLVLEVYCLPLFLSFPNVNWEAFLLFNIIKLLIGLEKAIMFI